MKQTYLIVLGTRPEAIKLAPVYRALYASPGSRVALLSTGQHREMLSSTLEVLELAPDHDLALMREAQTQPELIAAMLPRVSEVIGQLSPACVIVQGDTCSTFVGALAGYLQKTCVAHVEAGLRTGDKYSPFPEEGYRMLVSRIADVNFAPTEGARENLLREGIADDRILVTGNTSIDALRLMLERDPDRTSLRLNPDLRRLIRGRYVLITCHRRESFGSDLESMMQAVRSLACRHPEIHFVFPVHLNPNVGTVVYRLLGEQSNISLLPPVDYAAFAHLLSGCYLVLTDSGGIQEEAAALGKPVLVLRKTTERTEGIHAGTAILVGVEASEIERWADALLTDEATYRRYAVPSAVYGDGLAGIRIANALRQIVAESDKS